MNQFKKIIINSSLNPDLSKSWDSNVAYKLEISSITDEKININLDKSFSKNKIPFIAQREAAWIRLHFRDSTYFDFICDEILILASKNGILINLLGNCYKFTTEAVVKKIINYMKKNNIWKINLNVEFEYRKLTNKKIKKRLKDIASQKNNILINKFEYFKNRKKILKEAIELFVQKRYIEKNWKIINKIISNKLENHYE